MEWRFTIIYFQGEESNTEGPGKEFNDIAAAAESLQPKGYTLETTEVSVPFSLT